MPVDYSKWDALELSDDSDIEVHPNVDKRSFIRARQNQIHMERQHRREQMETLRYERQLNDGLMARISALLEALRAQAQEADVKSGARSPADVAFAIVMEGSAKLGPQDDTPPPPPPRADESEAAQRPPTYTSMMAALLDEVNRALDEKKVDKAQRFDAMVAEIEGHLAKVRELQAALQAQLAGMEREEGSKITSEDIHTGFDRSIVTRAKPEEASSGSGGGGGGSSSSGGGGGSSSGVELLNPGHHHSAAAEPAADADGGDDVEEGTASAEGKQFGDIKIGSYQACQSFLVGHPQILTEREHDGLMVMAFDAALEGKDELARQYVHQALLLQYCRVLGRDGVSTFFKRITTTGHQARDLFFKDLRETFDKIRTRARAIVAKRAQDAAEGKLVDGVEQIQLHAVEPGTVINITIPPAASDEPAEQAGRSIFDAFPSDMKRALESGSLDSVNDVLADMSVEDAEDLVGKLGEAGILSLEDEIIDTTTAEGQAQLKQLHLERLAAAAEDEETAADAASEAAAKEAAAAASKTQPPAELYGDPE